MFKNQIEIADASLRSRPTHEENRIDPCCIIHTQIIYMLHRLWCDTDRYDMILQQCFLSYRYDIQQYSCAAACCLHLSVTDNGAAAAALITPPYVPI